MGKTTLEKTRPVSLRLPAETWQMLEQVAGRGKSQYVDAVVRDAIARGVIVTVGGTLIESQGDLLAKPARKRRAAK